MTEEYLPDVAAGALQEVLAGFDKKFVARFRLANFVVPDVKS